MPSVCERSVSRMRQRREIRWLGADGIGIGRVDAEDASSRGILARWKRLILWRSTLALRLPAPGSMRPVKLRWRVAIVDDHERSRAALRAAIWAAGGEVAGEASRCVDAPALLERTKPSVAVFAVG